jgi:APA family basic amino acid/polyamine antiporter
VRVDGGPSLRRSLGLGQAVAVGVGGTVGGGIFVLVGVAASLTGPSALLSFAVAFVAAALIAMPYAELSCRLPSAGGGYAFVRDVLGSRWGFVMGWGYWGAYVFVSGYVTIGFGGYLHGLTGIPVPVGAVALAALATVVNLLGVRISGRAQSVVVGSAILGLLAFVVWGAPHLQAGSYAPLFPHGAGGVFSAALVAFLSFGGFDMVAAAGEEIAEPERNLPRAVLLTLGIVLVLYLAVTFVALGAVSPRALGGSSAPLADAAAAFGGAPGRRLVAATALLTTAATANAVLVVTSRIVFAMARDGLLPRWVARVNARTAVPAAAVIVNGVLLAAMGGLATVKFATSVGGFLYVLHFVPPLIALVVLRRRGTGPAAYQTPAPAVVLPLAFVASGALVVASGTAGVTFGVAWLGAGWLLFVLARRLSSRRGRLL